MRPAAHISLRIALLLTGLGLEAHADPVTGIAAVHRDGQTFLTWTAPTGTGFVYRAYASPTPIVTSADLTPEKRVGAVGDSTWCDVRLSRILGAVQGYAIDSAGAPLDSTQALMVVTAVAEGDVYYAVTAQAPGAAEDADVVPGSSALVAPVFEIPAAPRPVYQRSVIRYGAPVEIYTLWTSARETPFVRAMANRAGLAFDCGIVRGSPGGALMIRPHPYGQNFLLVTAGSGEPGEWRLTLDDPLPNADNHTWWYGYNESYDVTSNANTPPNAGRVNDYTFRRVRYTVDWARRAFPIDSRRIYASGFSMGGIGSLWLALLEPELIAAVHVEVPRFDFSSMDDPNLTNLWNEGGGFRRQGDRLWGPVITDLPSSDALPVYDRLNMRHLAAGLERRGMPPLIAFCGKNDRVLGWAEKIPFFAEMEQRRHGGTFFWDTRTHTSAGAWDPMKSARALYRFRSDRSYPALTACSADSDPGDGTAAGGDSVGVINGHVDWDTTVVDRVLEWSVTLRLRDLTATTGPVRAPDSVRVSVTPRRTRMFQVVEGVSYVFTVTRLGDGAIVQSGVIQADATGLLTVPNVRIDRSGASLRIEPRMSLDAPATLRLAVPSLVVLGNPIRRAATIRLTVPSAGSAAVDLLDVGGRVVRSLHRGPAAAGTLTLRLDATRLPAGVYFVAARQGGRSDTRRVVVLP